MSLSYFQFNCLSSSSYSHRWFFLIALFQFLPLIFALRALLAAGTLVRFLQADAWGPGDFALLFHSYTHIIIYKYIYIYINIYIYMHIYIYNVYFR